MSNSTLDIRNIDFGLAAAEDERTDRPELLLEGFLDAHGFVKEIRDGNRFVILGPKGSGKSAIASRIQLLAKREEGIQVTQSTLSSFSFNAFTEVLPGTDAPAVKFANNWEFLLLVALFDSLRQDSGCTTQGRLTHTKVIDALSKLGLVPSQNLTYLVKQTSSRKFKLGVPSIAELRLESEKEQVNPDVRFLFRTLQEVALSVRPSKKHLIFIDGLDDVQTHREKQYYALAALVVAVDRLNRQLREAGVSAKIVVLCRTDLFERLPGPNQNKIRQDGAIILDWFQESTDLKRTNLAKLLNHRAQVSLGVPVDLFEVLLPPTLYGQPTEKILFENTRHIPRDLIQLMNRVKDYSHSPVVPELALLNALRKYSEDYLVPEVKDEVAHLPDTEGALEAIQLIAMLGRRQFRVEDLEAVARKDDRFQGLDLRKSLERLFECSVIGTIRRGGGDETYHVTIRYRNPNAFFNPNDDIFVHRGLVKGLNLA